MWPKSGALRIDLALAETALEMLGVDAGGMDERDRKYLRALVGLFGGGPVGLPPFRRPLTKKAKP